jgi:hypothetical protein
MSCTGAMATGLTSVRGNLLGKTHDTPYDWETIRIQMVVPEEGYRYLKTVGPGPENLVPVLSEKGIGIVGFFRPAKAFAPYPGKPEYLTDYELMRTCGSAAEWVKTWSESMTRCGTPEGPGSIARLMIDTREGYFIEGANWIYNDPSNHTVHGPMSNQVFACANFFISAKLKEHAEAGVGLGYNRAKRAWQLLIDRQFDCCAQEIWTGERVNQPFYGSGITLPYLMSILRDHGNLPPEEARMSRYLPEERGKETICCHELMVHTKCATICHCVEEHPELLSCLWQTFGEPCLSPFVPVYIGVKEVPAEITGEANPVARVFEELRLALDYHPEFRQKIKDYWTTFEVHSVEESVRLEKEILALAGAGDTDGARVKLTEFVNKKLAEAVVHGRQWLDELKSLPILP